MKVTREEILLAVLPTITAHELASEGHVKGDGLPDKAKRIASKAKTLVDILYSELTK